MNKQEMIEKLKDPKQAQPFGLRTKEEREILDGAAKAECLYYSGVWKQMICEFSAHCTYILKPDYEETPEYVDREVLVSGNWLQLRTYVPGTSTRRITNIVEHKDFVQFFYHITDGKVLPSHHKVATAIREGHKVYARFVKETK